MRKSKFTESQIVATLKQVEGGRQVKDMYRELGISEAAYYTWKSKYGGMDASNVHRLRDLEAEHTSSSACTPTWRWRTTGLKISLQKNCRPGAEAPAHRLVDPTPRMERAPGM